MIWIHRAFLAASGLAMALAVLYAVRAVTAGGAGESPRGGRRESERATRAGPTHRARRAMKAAVPVFVFLLADGLGRIPVVMVAAEQTGSPRAFFWAVVDLALRNAVPVLLWGLALLGRWRGWLADAVFATAVLIAAAVTVLLYVVPLPGRGWPF